MPGRIVLYYNDLVFQPSPSFLFKDFGQVPYVLSELYGAELEYWIAAARPDPAFETFRGRRVRQFGKTRAGLPARLDALNNRALMRAIDRERGVTHLVVFPFTPQTDLAVARRAKRRWPGVKIIVKLDTNGEFLGRLAADWARYRRHPLRGLRQVAHYRALLAIADVVICETGECEALLRAGFLDLDLSAKLAKTFAGLSETWLSGIGVTREAAPARDNAIVVSGRISSRQKHSALILEAGPPPPGWRIDFIGEVDAALAQVIAAHRAADPDFDRRYRFHGAIADKRAYFDVLMRAKALLMNSRGGEGFPNVFAEAHFCGLAIASSDVSGAADATGDGRWGMIYPRDDVAALRGVLQALPALVAQQGDDPALDAYRRHFIWEHSLDQPVIRRAFDGPRG